MSKRSRRQYKQNNYSNRVKDEIITYISTFKIHCQGKVFEDIIDDYVYLKNSNISAKNIKRLYTKEELKSILIS